MTTSQVLQHSEIAVRPARETDLGAADRIIRLAFGTAAGAPDPEYFFGDVDTVQNRWYAAGTTVLVAEARDEIVGAIVVTRWGSFGFFGPFGVRPDLWDRGIAGIMVKAVMACIEQWGIRLAGLYTMPHSPKHLGLYQRFGFRPRQLTAVMEKTLGAPYVTMPTAPVPSEDSWLPVRPIPGTRGPAPWWRESTPPGGKPMK